MSAVVVVVVVAGQRVVDSVVEDGRFRGEVGGLPWFR